MQILGFQKTTLLDFPGHIASIIFTAGCNLRCPYCQNAELILPDQWCGPATDSPDALIPDSAAGPGIAEIPEAEVISHLSSHVGRIEGLVITGGEPTLQPDLVDFCKRVKELGLLVKLDTNGNAPAVVRELIDLRLVDYIALDVKLPTAAYDILLPENASDEIKKKTISNVRETLEILKNAPDHIDYETRTTIPNEFFDDDMMEALSHELAGVRRHFLQPYRDTDTVLIHGLHTPSEDALLRYRDILKKSIPQVEIRGMDI